MTAGISDEPRRIRRGRFFSRVFTRLALALSIGLALVCFLTWEVMQKWLHQNEIEQLRRHAQLAHEIVARGWPYPDVAALQTECDVVRENAHLRLTVINPSGSVIADSDADPANMENHAARHEVREALEGRVGMDERVSTTVGRSYIYVATPIRIDNQTVAVVRVAAPAEYVALREANLARWIGIGLAVALPLALAIAWFMARELAIPVQRVSRWARRLATGDLTTSLAIARGDEVGLVAESLERMRINLSARIREVQQQRLDLDVTIGQLEEGVIAVDREGKVLMANPAAGRLLGLATSLIGGPLREQLGARPLTRIWDDALAAGKAEISREVALNVSGTTRTLDAAVVRVDSTATPIAWLLCLRDITAVARSAAMKTDFVANASHELRTPVASIRAAVDTLREGNLDAETQERFIAVIERGVERLHNLTDDLMQLNRVESATLELKSTWFDPADGVGTLRASFAEVMAKTDVSLEYSGTIKQVFVDRRSFELVLKNLVDNAIKFVSSGGHIEIRGRKTGGMIWFDVQDDGCGIAREHLDRVFERFYQVDKSRGESRAGTGLGLAIVKHAVHAMGGEVSIASQVGVGTTVSFSIPSPPKSDEPGANGNQA